MAKPKKYLNWEIPTSVVEIVKAICADYYRRERIIKFGTATGSILERYVELNGAINSALQDIEVGLRDTILKDIQQGRGYYFSAAQELICKSGYYNRKRKLIYDIAISLSLL